MVAAMIGKTAAARLAGITATQPPRRSADEKPRLKAALTDLIEHRSSFHQVLGLTVQALASQLMLGFEMPPELEGHFTSVAGMGRDFGRAGRHWRQRLDARAVRRACA